MVASVHTDLYEIEFGEQHVCITLLGLQTLRSLAEAYEALQNSRHYSEGANLIWNLADAELHGLSDWDFALLTSRLARAPVSKRRARMVWVLPRSVDAVLEARVRRLMAKLQKVDWCFLSTKEAAVLWVKGADPNRD